MRAQLADAIPDKYHLSGSDQRCVLCALQKVVHDVVRDSTAGTHIVLVTQGAPDTLSLTDEKVVRGYVQESNLKLSTILLPDAHRFLPFYDKVGPAFVVRNDNSMVNFYTGNKRPLDQSINIFQKYFKPHAIFWKNAQLVPTVVETHPKKPLFFGLTIAT